MLLEPAIRNDFIELLAANFRTDEINELGRLVLGCFDSNEAAGEHRHISLSPRKAAGILVERCERGEETTSLLKLVVEVDNGTLHGRPVKLDGLEIFLGKLTRCGIRYDFRTRRILTSCQDTEELSNWGCLKEGRRYDVTGLSVDIVGNSAKVRSLGARRMEKLYFALWSFLREKLSSSDGRIWSWAGDGGVIAFALRDHVARAARFAVEVQSTVPIFNMTSSGSPAGDIALRVGIDTGRVTFLMETATIVSDVITNAAHLEKACCRPGMVCVSRPVYQALPERMRSLFRFGGISEEKDYFRTARRLDTPLGEKVPDGQPA
jgi:class 3 adenylate cyclase